MRVAALVMGIAGAIAVFFGLVFLLAGDEEYVALTGLTWQAGEVADVWAWLLMACGAALLVLTAALLVRGRRPRVR